MTNPTKHYMKKTKDQKAFERWAMPVLCKLQRLLLLTHFEPLDIEPSGEVNTSFCTFTYPYQSITIKYSNNVLSDWKNKKYASVKGVLAHEMSHPITDPLYAKATTQWISKSEVEDERERLTDHIANILIVNKLI